MAMIATALKAKGVSRHDRAEPGTACRAIRSWGRGESRIVLSVLSVASIPCRHGITGPSWSVRSWEPRLAGRTGRPPFIPHPMLRHLQGHAAQPRQLFCTVGLQRASVRQVVAVSAADVPPTVRQVKRPHAPLACTPAPGQRADEPPTLTAHRRVRRDQRDPVVQRFRQRSPFRDYGVLEPDPRRPPWECVDLDLPDSFVLPRVMELPRQRAANVHPCADRKPFVHQPGQRQEQAAFNRGSSTSVCVPTTSIPAHAVTPNRSGFSKCLPNRSTLSRAGPQSGAACDTALSIGYAFPVCEGQACTLLATSTPSSGRGPARRARRQSEVTLLRQLRHTPHDSLCPIMTAPPSPSPRCRPGQLRGVPTTLPRWPSNQAKCTSNRHKHNARARNPLAPQCVSRFPLQIVALVAAGSSPVSHPSRTGLADRGSDRDSQGSRCFRRGSQGET